jgi:hypothetical protein
MKNIYYNKVLIFLLILLFTSCEEYLEKYPIDNPSVSVFLTTERELELAVNGAYAALWLNFKEDLPFTQHLDLASDIGWNRSWGDFQELGNGKVEPTNPVNQLLWENLYIGVQRCNYAIKGKETLEKITDQDKVDRLVAEARVLRSYFYSHLVELFGDVPFYTSNLTLEESEIGRTSKIEIVDFILKELEEASGVIPLDYSSTKDIGRVTKGMTLALKSRVALYNENWDTAIDAAERVMELGYSLDDDYSQLYRKEYQQGSTEIIFKLDYLDGPIKGHDLPRWCSPRMHSGYSAYIPVQPMIDSYLCVDGLDISQSPLYDPQNPYENRDPRLHYSTIVPGALYRGIQYETHRDSVMCWDYNTNPPSRVANIDATNPYASFSGYSWRKYAHFVNSRELDNSETGVILMRYAEVLLNYAEAKIEANQIDESVYEALNLIRNRVDMPDVEQGSSVAELRSILRKERKVELAFEGLRLYDIRRWGIAEEVLNGPLYGRIPRGLLSAAPTFDENGTPDYSNVPNKDEMRIIEMRTFDASKNYLFPVPQFEIDINDLIEQNPNY